MKLFKILLQLSFLLLAVTLKAEKIEKYKGVAYDEKNNIVYIEKHTATFSNDGKALKATTIYTDPKGKVISEMTSDFSSHLSAPIYTYKDHRHKTGHGIKYNNNTLILIDYLENGTAKTKPLTEKFSKESLIIGGQGLHYYLISNLEKVKLKKTIPLIFLTPGNLGYYKFKLNYLGKNKKGLIELEVEISNFFLRLFAPKLSIFYNPKTKKLAKYFGLSNVKSDKNKNQAVTIHYEY